VFAKVGVCQSLFHFINFKRAVVIDVKGLKLLEELSEAFWVGHADEHVDRYFSQLRDPLEFLECLNSLCHVVLLMAIAFHFFKPWVFH
jgi:hypothetical protein